MSSNRYSQEEIAKMGESDQPIFILKAQDTFAPITLQYWIGLMQRSKGDPKLIELAKEQYKNMVNWQKKHGFKVPDLEAKDPIKVTFSDGEEIELVPGK